MPRREIGDQQHRPTAAARCLRDRLQARRHAQPLLDAIEVDNGDEGSLRHWQHQLGVLSGHSDEADWSAPAYGRWRLAGRRVLNPGSAGEPVFHLSLTPLDLPSPQWQAGDIAEIGPHNSGAAVNAFLQAIGRQDDSLRAALATRLLRERGSKVVQVLDPRIDPRHWDLVVAPEHDGLRGENVIAMLGSLHPVDDLWLAEGRRDFPALALLPRPRVALLIGGPSPHWPLAGDAFVAMLRAIAAGVHAVLTAAERAICDTDRSMTA